MTTNIIDSKSPKQLGDEFLASLERQSRTSAGNASYHVVSAIVDFIRVVGTTAFGDTLGMISGETDPEQATYRYHKLLRQADPFTKTGCNSLLWHLLNLNDGCSFWTAIEEVCFEDREEKIDKFLKANE